MEGFLLLRDGTELPGVIRGGAQITAGWLAVNTSVVGFQEMATDPAYKAKILSFTYPEVGNVGVSESFNESADIQAAGLVVKVLSDFTSHYRASDNFEAFLSNHGVPCLTGIDTRGLGIHIRENGEMPAAIAPADADRKKLGELLNSMERQTFEPSSSPAAVKGGTGKRLAVIDLGIRRSQLDQLRLCSKPVICSHDSDPETILSLKPDGLFISDGPGGAMPPEKAVETIKNLLMKLPLLAGGAGHIALGLALGCRPEFLKRGHHGANYPVRNLQDQTAEVTQQRHSLALNRDSVVDNPDVELAWENINDLTVEGILSRDGSAAGFQSVLEPPGTGQVNKHILQFVNRLD
jgi:carbamoyl-phosphate synthase small subunit